MAEKMSHIHRPGGLSKRAKIGNGYGVAANKQGREVKGQMQRTKTVIRIVVLLEPYTNVVNWITAVSSEGLVLVYVYPMKYKSPADYQVA
jgi:hypothetical protein